MRRYVARLPDVDDLSEEMSSAIQELAELRLTVAIEFEAEDDYELGLMVSDLEDRIQGITNDLLFEIPRPRPVVPTPEEIEKRDLERRHEGCGPYRCIIGDGKCPYWDPSRTSVQKKLDRQECRICLKTYTPAYFPRHVCRVKS